MRKNRSVQFIPYTIAGVFGVVLLCLPTVLSANQDLQESQAKSLILSQENINRDRIKERAKTAKLMQSTGLLPEGKTLTITGYLDNSKKPPGIANKRLSAYLPDEIVHIYDESRTCIGVIKNRKFFWKREFAATCVDAPLINSDK